VPAVWLVAGGYAFALLGTAVRLLRCAPVRDLGPLALMQLTQATWFSVPVLVKHWGLAGSVGSLVQVYTAYGFIWVAAAHAVQYLWVTTYYATVASGPESRPRYLLKTMLAGATVWFIPGMLFAPGYLGRLPNDAGLALMVAAVVNLHHFVLDGAIWKLRDGRVARLLVRPPAPEPLPVRPRRALWGIATPLWVVGGFALCTAALDIWESHRQVPRALERRDAQALEEAVRRLAWIGRDSATLHVQLAGLHAGQGEPARARRELQRSLALQPTAGAWVALAKLAEQEGRREEALAAYQSALVLEPRQLTSLYRGGVLLLELGRPEQAQELLSRAAERAPNNRLVQLRLERARTELESRAAAGRE
jgi:hypothetical protein